MKMDFTSKNDQDEIWGKVIDAVDDDSMWEGNLDDFSVSVYRKSLDLISTTKIEKKAIPISRIKATTAPVSSGARLSTAKAPETTISNRKTKNIISIDSMLASDESQKPPENPRAFHEDWAIPLEITTTNSGMSQSAHATTATPCQRLKPLNRSFGDLAALMDVEEKLDLNDNFYDSMSVKFNKSFGDLPSNDLSDLMKSPIEFLRSLEKKNKAEGVSRKNKQDRMTCSSKGVNDPFFEGVAGFPRSAIATDKTEKRPHRDRKKVDKSPSRFDKRRSRSADNKIEKSNASRQHRSRSRGVARRDSEKEHSSFVVRSRNKTPNPTNRRDSRTSDGKLNGRDRSRSSRRSRSRSNGRSRSRSNGPTMHQSRSSNNKREVKDKSSRGEGSISRRRNKSDPSERSVSPLVRSRQYRRIQRGSEKRLAPRRTRSDDLLDVLNSSMVGDLDLLGISMDEQDALISLSKKFVDSMSSPKRPIARAKSLMSETRKELKRDLQNGLSLVDKSSMKSPSKRSDELKSISGTSNGTHSSKRSSGSSRGSVRSIQSKESLNTAERLLREQAKLAREQRKAEEAKLKRLQEEARILEGKTRSEEVRLKALKEEAKLIEARRLGEETRIRVEAQIEKERKEVNEAKKVKEPSIRMNEAATAKGLWKDDDNQAEDNEQLESIEECGLQTSKEDTVRENSHDLEEENIVSVVSTDVKKNFVTGGNEPRQRSSSSLSSKKPKFGGSPVNIQHLPPAFQLLYEHGKRVSGAKTS